MSGYGVGELDFTELGELRVDRSGRRWCAFSDWSGCTRDPLTGEWWWMRRQRPGSLLPAKNERITSPSTTRLLDAWEERTMHVDPDPTPAHGLQRVVA